MLLRLYTLAIGRPYSEITRPATFWQLSSTLVVIKFPRIWNVDRLSWSETFFKKRTKKKKEERKEKFKDRNVDYTR